MADEQWMEAIPHLDQSVQAAPHYSFSYVARGICLQQLARSDQAREDFAEAVRRNPDNPAARRGYGAALAQEGLQAEAEEQYRAAIGLNALDDRARLGMAGVLDRRGRRREADHQRTLVAQIRSGRTQGRGIGLD